MQMTNLLSKLKTPEKSFKRKERPFVQNLYILGELPSNFFRFFFYLKKWKTKQSTAQFKLQTSSEQTWPNQPSLT